MSCHPERSDGSLNLSRTYQLDNLDLEVRDPSIQAGLASSNAAQDDKAASPE